MFRLTWRTLLARKARLVMSTLAIVLGIGFLSGVLTFSSGLSATFNGIIDGSTPAAVVRPAGTASFEAVGAGNTQTLAPEDVARLAALPEVARADGSIDGFGLYVLDPDLKLVGTGGAPTLSFNYTDSPNLSGQQILVLDDGRWPEADDEIALDTGAARNAGYEVGDQVTVIPPGVDGSGPITQQLELVGLAGFNAGAGTAGATLVIFNTSGAQAMFLDGADAFTSVGLTATDGVDQEQLAEAAAQVLPAGYEAVAGDVVAEESKSAVGEFLGFIDIFLGAFAVIAVIVGGFIIANTFSILVAQRTRELALLRGLGASRAQVRRSVLLEAALTAMIGSTAGLLLGLGLARALAALFNGIGLPIDAAVLTLTSATVLTAYVVGLGVTLASAYLPARRAAQVAPVVAMREDTGASEAGLRRRTLVGAVLLVVGAALAAVGLVGAPGNDALYLGAGAVLWVLTVAAISPVLGRPVLLGARRLFGAVFGTTGRLAGDNALRNPRRTGATASALMIGLALVSAVGVLAASVSASTDQLVDEQFEADFLVQSPVFGSFPVAIGDRMSRVEGVEVLSRQQALLATVGDDEDPTYVVAADGSFGDVYDLTMLEGHEQPGPGEVVVSASTAEDRGFTLGATTELGFPGDQQVPVTVAGIFEDSQVAGPFNVGFDVLETAGVRRVDTTLSINTAPGADVVAVKAALDALVADLPIVAVQDKEEFADSITAQINQLLYIVYGLLALSVVIAVIGIVNTLSLSVLERTREIGLLRAVGLSRRRLRLMVTLESVTISMMGAVLGLLLGVLIGVLLQRSLRDDLSELAVPLPSLAVFLLIAVVFGVVAAILPAVRASRMNVLDAIATE
ncbi:Macrolide export ATP-binding/permease protein MacB [Nocardioides dokdonensis FR1436]|uniref:Macrolide export ATP-binding/permease protein MacB n=1 Tax=Nocardioides dokdonensis FR1436 TaxID=1300347 RepID=A0A1A9GLN9_9ACTN|nr:FtsX-like permease family protein [Nocardioides dokdonensis]ANH38582.1 Macrolide export ATP-binding/permease protein MacB [Nocardioides dokdonensis FR1436]